MPKNDAPVGKSQAIRDFVSQHPDAPVKTVIETLAAQGIQVSRAFVSVVRDVLKSPRPPVPELVMPAMGKSKPKNWATGRWLIESMDQWDTDFIDEEVRGYFEFDAEDSGSIQFGHVQGDLDYRLTERDGKPAVEFSWDGNDEMEPAQGRGWLILQGDELKGMFFFHQGDESGIVLRREPKRKPRKRK